jgi:hypothetical protein
MASAAPSLAPPPSDRLMYMMQLVFRVPFEVAISQEGHMLMLFIQGVVLLHVGLLWMRKSINLAMRIMTKLMKSTWLNMMKK